MMKNLQRFNLMLVVLALLFVFSACVTNQGQRDKVMYDQKLTELQQQKLALEKQEQDLGVRKGELVKQEQDLSEKMLAMEKAAGTTPNQPVSIDTPLLPPDAKAGECYARVFVPPTYKTITKTVLKKAESQRIEVIPATYKMVDKRVLVSEASQKLVTIPAKYGSQSKEVLVQAGKSIWQTSLNKGGAHASDVLLTAAQKHGIDLGVAHPGDCFHEHYLPPVFETITKDELIAEESYRIVVIPAQYKMVEEKVLVREASKKLVAVPTTYKWVQEKMLIKKAHTAWKKGRGLIQRIDDTTGEIMCLITVPAEYKIVKKKVVDKTASTVTQIIPAVYKTIKVRKLVSATSEKKIVIPARYKKIKQQKLAQAGRFVWHEIHNLEHPRETRTGNKICLVETPAKYRKATKKVVVEKSKTNVQEIPAVYKTVKVRTVVSDAKIRKIDIPAEYQTVTKQQKVSEGELEWRQVLCETNTTSDVISKLQSALISRGYNPGPADGAYGPVTERAVKKYQKDKGLGTGGITYETLKHLGL